MTRLTLQKLESKISADLAAVAYRNSKPFNNQCGRRGDQRRRVMYRIQRLHKNARIARSWKRHICLTKLNSENTFQSKLPPKTRRHSPQIATYKKKYFLKLPQCFQKKMQWPDFEVQDSDCTHTNPFNYFDRVGRIFHSDLVVLSPVVVVNCCAYVAHSLTL